MEILVTGGAGFIGSHITDRLIKEGHNVVIVDNLYSGKRENKNPAADFVKMDIRDKEAEGVFKKNNFDAIFHLAAQMDVRKSIEDPFLDADINILGGINILQNAVKYNVRKVVFASSGGVMYGECADRYPEEDEYPNPLCPYGASKLAMEFYLNFYQDNYGLDSAVLRFGNVYGPRQDPHGEAGVIAIFAGRMLKGEDIYIFGDGKQVRDYVYVGDVVEANIRALKKGAGVYNIGTGESESVNELFDILKEITGYGKDAVYEAARSGELQVSRLGVKKAAEKLGVKAGVSFKEGLKETVEHFREKIREKRKQD
ncbi:MAG: NAD-dependent epimerase/dehydratase family protein [Elusimicrobia bacterium]|nr:NAD-dependent epimerase/dehydratase family protein [Elusimicrobiota bacterium]